MEIKSTDLICQNFNYGFAASTWQMFTSLMTGSKVVIIDQKDASDPVRLAEHLMAHGFTILEMIPSYCAQFIELVLAKREKDILKKIKTIILTGEELPASLANKLGKLKSVKIVNAYGPTEYTDDALYYELEKNMHYNKVPLGKPAHNTSVYILDDKRDLTPPTQTGEIYLSGDGLAKGYLDEVGQTRKSYIPNPFKKDGIVYKTGDLAKVGADYKLYYIGRRDRQVKNRGYRVDMSEVENYINEFPGVMASIVKLVNGKISGLTAYYVAHKIVDNEGLRRHLLNILPEYMVPNYFIRLDELPMNENGKIDYRALPTPTTKTNVRKEAKEPRTKSEIDLLNIWQEILGVKDIGLYDNFFSIGGDSLKIIKMQVLLEKLYPGKVNAAKLFIYPTIHEMAEYLSNSKQENFGHINKKNLKNKITELINGVENGALSIDKAINDINSLKESG